MRGERVEARWNCREVVKGEGGRGEKTSAWHGGFGPSVSPCTHKYSSMYIYYVHVQCIYVHVNYIGSTHKRKYVYTCTMLVSAPQTTLRFSTYM